MLSGIKALFFDLDNTLLDDITGTREALKEVCCLACRQRGVNPQQLYRAVKRQARLLWQESPFFSYLEQIEITFMEGLCVNQDGGKERTGLLREWLLYYRLESWQRALEELEIFGGDLAELLASVYVIKRRAHNYLFPDAGKTLEALRPLYRLAVITNGASDLQRSKINASRLESYFERIFVSGEVGVGKPQAGIFTFALEELGVAPTQAAMIGDNYLRDIDGAKRAGLRTIWFRRKARVKADGSLNMMYTADLIIPTLGALLFPE